MIYPTSECFELHFVMLKLFLSLLGVCVLVFIERKMGRIYFCLSGLQHVDEYFAYCTLCCHVILIIALAIVKLTLFV